MEARSNKPLVDSGASPSSGDSSPSQGTTPLLIGWVYRMGTLAFPVSQSFCVTFHEATSHMAGLGSSEQVPLAPGSFMTWPSMARPSSRTAPKGNRVMVLYSAELGQPSWCHKLFAMVKTSFCLGWQQSLKRGLYGHCKDSLPP